MDNNVKEAYNKICDHWSTFRNNTPINQCIIDFAKMLKPNSHILDVGCGSGYPIASYLSKLGFKVTGIDISNEMIKKAQQLNLPNASFIVEDLLNYKSEERYDAIIAFDSIWHIDYDNQEKIYQIVSSLLVPNGLFIFTHGKNDGEIIGTMWGESFYHSALDAKKVVNLLEQNHFKIVAYVEDYEEKTTGDRELLIVAQKI
ncbi:MAG: class I SAM-dependent methyltransferase [Bacilli bacterium]|nr:class I SAM-dependent methyltransferase [Bacilli bacterium]